MAPQLFTRVILAGLAASMVQCAASLNDTVLLNNGVVMPMLSFGTYGFYDHDVEDAVVAAIGTGLRSIDTAASNNNQQGIGRALKRTNVARYEIFVIAKTVPCHGLASGSQSITDVAACRNQTEKDIESTLQELGLDYVDLLLLQGTNRDSQQSGCGGELSKSLNSAQWAVYENYLAKGKVNAIGVAEFCVPCLDALMFTSHITPAVNQVMLHVGMSKDPENVTSYCHNYHIVPMASSVLVGGEDLQDEVVTQVGTSHNKTSAQVGLKWILSHGMPLATQRDYQTVNHTDLELFSWDLSSQEMAQLDSLKLKDSRMPLWCCSNSGNMLIV